MQLTHSQNTVTTSNINRIANGLMEKLGQCNKMFEKLQEMANKQVEKYTGLFTENRNHKQRYEGKQILNKMCKQRQKNTCTRGNIPHLEANKKHKHLSNKILTEDQINK